MNKGHITILSCGIGTDSLNKKIRDTVSDSKILAGGQRLLYLFPDFPGEKIVFGKNTSETILQLTDRVLNGNEKVTILASGDALFYGIGKTMAEKIPVDQLTIIPNITAMQAVAAELCLPWDEVKTFSVHGNQDEILPLRAILSAKFAIIYADPKCTASRLAELLFELQPEAGNRPAAIAENLGLHDQNIYRGTLQEMSRKKVCGLSILVLLEDQSISLGLPLGQPDDKFVHQRNMITHPEIRAIAISKLRLGPGIMWDLGAGCGSVGIEAACLCPDLEVFAIEKNAERVEDIKSNAGNFGVGNLIIQTGDAVKMIENLPAPRAVFIGGGGNEVSKILEKAFNKLLPGGIIVATAVLLETRMNLGNTLKENCIEILSLSVSRAKSLGDSRMMKSENNIEMYIYRK